MIVHIDCGKRRFWTQDKLNNFKTENWKKRLILRHSPVYAVIPSNNCLYREKVAMFNIYMYMQDQPKLKSIGKIGNIFAAWN